MAGFGNFPASLASPHMEPSRGGVDIEAAEIKKCGGERMRVGHS